MPPLEKEADFIIMGLREKEVGGEKVAAELPGPSRLKETTLLPVLEKDCFEKDCFEKLTPRLPAAAPPLFEKEMR